jgi:pimeloyl-ACP methyl ester carboxylesterase
MDSETAFGPQRKNWPSWNPFVVVRHGILSSDVPFQGLSKFIESKFPTAIVDNQKYTWTDSVVLNGARLAKAILDHPDAKGRPVILIGHSMGGLVCRVANLLLTQPGLIPQNRLIFQNYCDGDGNDFEALIGLGLDRNEARTINLVVTLGTPNSGAMLKAQLSALGDLVGKALAFKFTSLKDLNTARLFQLLQYFSVSTPTLSISGSGWNRFKKAPAGPIFWAPHLAARLQLPNDMIVEDRSVDLAQSILPNEVLSAPARKYLHVRLYTDCIDVIHTTIYDHWKVKDILIDCMARC